MVCLVVLFVMNGHILLEKFDLSKGSCSFFVHGITIRAYVDTINVVL